MFTKWKLIVKWRNIAREWTRRGTIIATEVIIITVLDIPEIPEKIVTGAQFSLLTTQTPLDTDTRTFTAENRRGGDNEKNNCKTYIKFNGIGGWDRPSKVT